MQHQSRQQQPTCQNFESDFTMQTIYSLNLEQLSQPSLSDHLLKSLNNENHLVVDLCKMWIDIRRKRMLMEQKVIGQISQVKREVTKFHQVIQ